MHLRRVSAKFLLSMVAVCLACSFSLPVPAQSCGATGVAVQVLGSGGPDLRDGRASSSYLVWDNGRAVVLVDAGGGSALRFGESGARISQLKVILLTHLHADHTSDLPALVWSSHFEGRKLPLPVFGPPGNDSFPSTTEFFQDLFGKPHGAWRYMSFMMAGSRSYQLQPQNVTAGETPVNIFRSSTLAVDAVRVHHGPAPALAYRVEIDGERIVFSGDTDGRGKGLPRLAENADIFIAHNATSRFSYPGDIAMLMPPLVIGQIAAEAHVKRLVLSHRMAETLGKEHQAQTREDIRKHYTGPLEFANDLDCFPVK